MNKQELQDHITQLAQDRTELEIITLLQSGAASVGDEVLLDQLCKMKNVIIDEMSSFDYEDEDDDEDDEFEYHS